MGAFGSGFHAAWVVFRSILLGFYDFDTIRDGMHGDAGAGWLGCDLGFSVCCFVYCEHL